MSVTYGTGAKDDPWVLKTPPQSSEFHAWKDEAHDPPRLVVQVGATQLSYHLRCIEDCAAMLAAHGDWMPLGNADEGKPTKPGTIEDWARDARNPVGGYYGLRKGLSRPVCQLRHAGDGIARAGRAGTQRPQQPGAGAVAVQFSAGAK